MGNTLDISHNLTAHREWGDKFLFILHGTTCTVLI